MLLSLSGEILNLPCGLVNSTFEDIGGSLEFTLSRGFGYTSLSRSRILSIRRPPIAEERLMDVS